MIEINDANGPDAFKEECNYLLMFYTDWCPRCPPLAEALDKLQKSRNTEFEFVKINYDHNPEAVDYFNVIGVPFVFAIKEKSVIAGWGGLVDKNAYEKSRILRLVQLTKSSRATILIPLLLLERNMPHVSRKRPDFVSVNHKKDDING